MHADTRDTAIAAETADIAGQLSSVAERDRRYAALRKQMSACDLDALLIAARGDGCSRGRLTYLANIRNFVEPCSIMLLPLEGTPVLFMDPVRIYALSDWIPDVRATEDRGRDLAICMSELGLADSRIGTIGFEDSLTLKDWRSLSTGLPNAVFHPADRIYETATCRKTKVEVSALRHSAAIVRRAADALEGLLRPGVLPAELIAETHRSLRLDGCTDAAVAFSRRPFQGLGCRAGGWLIGGTAPDPAPLARDDLIVIEMDVAGPEGYWVEIRRRYRFSAFHDDERRFWDMRCEAFDAAFALMKPGVDSAELEQAINDVYRREGYSNHGQVSLHAHGTGVNAVEAPTCPGAARVLEAGMAVVLHPLLWLERAESRLLSDLAPVDAVLITDSGPVRLVDEYDEMGVVDA